MTNSGLLVLYRKELADHLRSKRFVILLILITVTGLASIYAAASGIREAVAQEGNEFVFLRLLPLLVIPYLHLYLLFPYWGP